MQVKTGAQAWREHDFNTIDGMRIGLVANHSAMCQDGKSTLSALLEAETIQVCRLFAPEHGAFGIMDSNVPDDIEPLTGLPIRSLFGVAKKPSCEDLDGLDALVFEMQDIGARFYTYSSTLGLCLEACAEVGIPLIVFDRPNPVTGLHVEGPLPDADRLSFTAYHTIPIRHGLTLGELARLYAIEKGIEDAVWVSPCLGWKRDVWFDQTGLDWINPSPAMKSLTAAALYCGVCLLEQTNVSVGRGTDTPFEVVGAPFISPREWIDALEKESIAGVSFEPAVFTPTLREYEGLECSGIRIALEDRDALDSVRLGVALISTLIRVCPVSFNASGVLNLLANKKAYDGLIAGASVDDICQEWSADLEEWEKRRKKALLYD
jgi:uncharacterized protein YbbC (DUF1343 family)